MVHIFYIVSFEWDDATQTYEKPFSVLNKSDTDTDKLKQTKLEMLVAINSDCSSQLNKILYQGNSFNGEKQSF